MATKGNLPTLLDLAAGMGDAQVALVDALTSDAGSAIYRVMPMRQVTGWAEQFTRKTGRPNVSFRDLGGGITPGKMDRTPVREGIFLLSGASEVDRIKADRDPRGTAAYREEEDGAYLESMGHTLSFTTFYGSGAREFDGLLKRLPSGADTYVNAGAASETTSIYALKFGPGRFMGLYNVGPSGDIVEAFDYGAITEKDTDGDIQEIYRMTFNAGMGLGQYHPKAIGRIGRINASNKPTAKDFTELFGKMGWKPDVLVTTWTGAGYISELKQTALRMAPGERNYDIEVDNYAGIPIIVDPALSDAEDGVL